MVIILSLCAFLVSSTISAQQQLPEHLTMADAVQQALEHKPNLQALKYSVQASKSASKSAMAEYYPTVGLTSEITQDKGETEFDSQTALTAKQLVYSFAGPRQKYQKAKNEAQITELERIKQTNDTRLITETSFLQAWLVQEKEKAIAAQKKSTQTTFQRQEHKNKLAQLDKDVWLKNVADYATGMAKVDQYHEDVLIKYRKLEFLMGQSLTLLPSSDDNKPHQSRTHLVWHYKKKYTLEPLDTYYHYALTTRPEVPRGLKKMAVEKWNIKLMQGTRLPEITASANVSCLTDPNGTTQVTPSINPEIPSTPATKAISTNWSLGVQLTWSLFDGLVQQYNEQQARANKVKEMLNHEQDILDIKEQVHEKYCLLVKELKKLNAQKVTYLYGRNQFKLAKQKFELGKIAQADFDAAVTDWHDIQFDWLSYNVDVANAECELAWACGYPAALMLS